MTYLPYRKDTLTVTLSQQKPTSQEASKLVKSKLISNELSVTPKSKVEKNQDTLASNVTTSIEHFGKYK